MTTLRTPGLAQHHASFSSRPTHYTSLSAVLNSFFAIHPKSTDFAEQAARALQLTISHPAMSPNSSTPEMSSATKELLVKVRQIVPPMLEKFHKGKSFSRL